MQERTGARERDERGSSLSPRTFIPSAFYAGYHSRCRRHGLCLIVAIQKFWMTTVGMRSLSNDDGADNKNGKEAMGL